MKRKITIMLITISSVLTALNSYAQLGSGAYFTRFDSIDIGTHANKTIAFQSKVFLISHNKVGLLDTITENVSEIYNTTNYIGASVLDSAYQLCLLEYNKLKRFNGTNWATINIPSNNINFHNMVVDSSGAIFFNTNSTDTLIKYSNGIFTKSKITFPTSNEHIAILIAGPNHDCRIISSTLGVYNLYKLQGTNLVWLNQLPNGNKYNYDSNGNLWFDAFDSICYITPTNSIFSFNEQNSPYSYGSTFGINESGNQLWLLSSNDSLNYFDGFNWYSMGVDNSYSQNYLPLDVYSNELFLITINGLTDLKKIRQNYFVNSYALSVSLSLLANTITSINYSEHSLISSNRGILQYCNAFCNYTYKLWDTSNTNLLTNKINCLADNGQILNTSNWNYYNSIFIGTDLGISKAIVYNDSLVVVQNFNSSNSILPTDTILKFYNPDQMFNNGQDCWFILKNNGCGKISNNGNITLYNTTNSSLPSNNVNRININNNNYSIGISTDNGILIIKDTLQIAVTPINSSMPNSNISDVFVTYLYQNKMQYLISTYGDGMFFVDTTFIWHPYNTNTGNLNTDTVNFISNFSNNNPFNNSEFIIGTNNGLYSFNSYNNPPLSISQIDFDTFYSNYNYKEYLSAFFQCGKGGWLFQALTDSGFISQSICWGNIPTETYTTKLKAWFNNDKLIVEFNDTELEKKIEIIDLTGKKVFESNIANSTKNKIEIKHSILSKGIYLVKLSTNKNVYSTKISYH